MVLSDDCILEKAIGGEGRPTRSQRILFAPVVEAAQDEAAELEGENFGRFPLLSDTVNPMPAIVELRRCFMVDSRDVAAALSEGAFVVRSLTDDTLAKLAIRWSAYSIRRGPFVASDNAEKFAEALIEKGRSTESEALEVATLLAEVVGAAWVFEGRSLEGAGAMADTGTNDVDLVLQDLITDLEELQRATAAALRRSRQV